MRGLARFMILGVASTFGLAAQTSVSGRLWDPSNTPVGGVSVLLRQGAIELSTTTSSTGEFRFDGLQPGQYDLLTTLAGFDPVRRAVRVGRTPVRDLVIRLKLATLKAEVSVPERDNQVSVSQERNADTISVERSLLENLPVLDHNYLSALSRFLDPGSPGGAGTSLIVDGMESRNVGVTPSAIQEIRINNNPYTVEYPRWSRRRIEIITKASTDQYHGTLNLLFRDHRLNARDALAVARPQEQRRIVEGSLFGPLAKSKSASFLLSGAREEEDLVAVVFAQGLGGPVNQNVPTPQVNTVGSLRITQQLDQNHAVFWQANFQDRWNNNSGAGGTTLAEAAAQTRFREDELVFNHRAVVTPKFLSQFRILVGRYWAPTKSNLVRPKITVSDAFTGGGAQNDRVSTEFHTSITWLLSQTIGRHSLKYGVNVPDWSRRGLRDETNLLGTFSFASLADYAAGRPFAAVVQRGDPKSVFIEKNLGGFFQDEWQLRPNLSLAGGFRYDWQNFFGDRNNFAPRIAIAWAPAKSRKWVIRSGAGFFFERSGPLPLFDILRYNGVRLRRFVLSAAEIPSSLSVAPPLDYPSSVHRLEPGAGLPNIMQFSAGVERQINRRTLLAITYNGTRGVQQLRSRDTNAPLPPLFGARPDPRWSVLRQIESAGRMEANTLEIMVRGDIAPRVTGMAQYVWGKTLSDTGGLNWFPASSFAPQGEWGRTESDRRSQFNFLGTATLHRWLNLGISAALLSGLAFNVTTGGDDNRDGMAIDRPPGVSRNTGPGPETIGLDLRWYRDFRLEPLKKDRSPTLTFSVDAFNILNRVNFQNYIGALTSPFFGRAVATLPPRRAQLGVRFQF